MKRVVFVGLDGLEPTLAEAMMQAGALPHLSKLRHEGIWCRLQDYDDYRIGLVWEEFVLGTNADSNQRWSALAFDPQTYRIQKIGAGHTPPFYKTDPPLQVIAFDVPYVNLNHDIAGALITGWGAHDPGYPRASKPMGLLKEIDERFGPHPACNNDYAIVWHRPEACERLTSALIQGAKRRAQVANWLQTQVEDWDLLMTVMSEGHSAGEQLWHGLTDETPLAKAESAAAAGQQIKDVYCAIDEAIGLIAAGLPEDTALVLASLHGMDVNKADLASMLMLPEFLYRLDFQRPFLGNPVDPVQWKSAACPFLPVPPHKNWGQYIHTCLNNDQLKAIKTLIKQRKKAAGPCPATPTMGPAFEGALGIAIPQESALSPQEIGVEIKEVDWQPSAWYSPVWPQMRVFALPTFYDGRIRLNVKDRERQGCIEPDDYHRVCDEIEQELRACIDVRTGRPMVREILHLRTDAPLDPQGPDADLVVVWDVVSDAMAHPKTGVIGPFPFRRSGGHSPHGFLSITGPGIGATELEARSARDLPPTLLRLLNRSASRPLDGTAIPESLMGLVAQ